MRIVGINYTNIVPHITFKGNDNKKTFLKPEADEFVRSTGSLNITKLKEMEIAHFRLIDSNSVRGISLADKKPEVLTKLKEYGVNTIIDLRREGGKTTNYAKECNKNGLDYFSFKVKDNMPIFTLAGNSKLPGDVRKVKCKEFVQQLPQFFEKMDEGRCYMHCMLGLHRTDLAVVLNYLINPKEPSTVPTLSHMYRDDETNFTNKYVAAMKNLLSNIDKEDREYLGLPENYSEIFNGRVLKLKMMNGIKV